MRKQRNYKNWEDCIHIGACRRLSKMFEQKTGQPMARGCGEHCNMFKSRSMLIARLQSIANDIDDNKYYLRRDLNTQLPDYYANNEVINYGISLISTRDIHLFIDEELNKQSNE